jgi:hypothetical protein
MSLAMADSLKGLFSDGGLLGDFGGFLGDFHATPWQGFYSGGIRMQGMPVRPREKKDIDRGIPSISDISLPSECNARWRTDGA